jgi:anti-sigma B factor antagonist
MVEVNSGSHAEIKVSQTELGHLTAKISGELDIMSVERLNPQIESLVVRSADRVDLDLSELEFMDSSGLGLLLRITNAFGPQRVLGARPLIRRVIEVTGLTEVFYLEEETT